MSSHVSGWTSPAPSKGWGSLHSPCPSEPPPRASFQCQDPWRKTRAAHPVTTPVHPRPKRPAAASVISPTPDRTVERDPEIHGGGRRFQTLWSHRHKLEPSPSTQAQPSFPLSPEFFLWQFYRITISLGPLRHREMGFWEVLSFLAQLALNLSDPSPTTQWPSSATSGASVVTGKE